MSKRWIAVLAFIAAAPTMAAAQFTTFIAPPNPVKDSIKAAVVAEQKATTDSVTRAQITNMKAWVDSAAGIVIPAVTDSAFVAKGTEATTSFVANGTVAPATASTLPLLLVLGGAGMVLGALLMRRPRPVRVDSR